MNRRCITSRAGFTLIELILVLVLIAVLTTLATPSLRGFARRAALDDTAASLLTLAEQARTRAAHEAVPHRVVFDLDQHIAWLEHIGDEGFEEVNASGVEPVQWGASVKIVAELDLTQDGLPAINCQPNGLTSLGCVVIEQEGQFVVLICDTPTARFRIITPQRDSTRNAEGVLDAMRL